MSEALGYRTEQLYGEGYRDAASVMAHETFELGNTDILDTLSLTLFHETLYGEKLKHLADVINCKISDATLNEFLDGAIKNDTVGVDYFKGVLQEIRKITGKDIKYALWLCDSIEDIQKEYGCDESCVELAVFDSYRKSSVILSDLGLAGKLYGYESKPVPC